MATLADAYKVYNRSFPEDHVCAWLHRNNMISNGSQTREDIPDAVKRNRDRCGGRPCCTTLDKFNVWVPSDRRNEFLKRIAYSISQNHDLYFNQISYGTSRFVVDIDTKTVHLPPWMPKCMLNTLLDVFRMYFTNIDKKPIPAFMSACGPRMKYSKKGSHMCCNYHIVTGLELESLDQARQIMMTYSRKMNEVFEEHNIDPKHVEIDSSIYKKDQVCLRMIYSRKIIDCYECHNDKDLRNACVTCDQVGWLAEKFTYEPILTAQHGSLDTDEQQEKINGTLFHTQLKNNQIWPLTIAERRNDYRVPDSEETLEEHRQFVEESKKNTKPGKMQVYAKVNADGQLCSSFQLSKDAHQRLKEFVHTLSYHRRNMWKGSLLFYRKNLKTTMLIALKGSNHRWCPYVNREHKSNSVYLILRQKGEIEVGCYDEVCAAKAKDKSNKIIFPFDDPVVLRSVFGQVSKTIQMKTTIPTSSVVKKDVGKRKRKSYSKRRREDIIREQRDRQRQSRIKELDELLANVGQTADK